MSDVNSVRVEPLIVGVLYPNKGNKDSSFKLKVVNETNSRQAFKVKVDQADRFRIGPVHGYVDVQSHKMIVVRPWPFDETKQRPLAKDDKFTILVAAIPQLDCKPADVWKEGSPFFPSQINKFNVKIQYCKPGQVCPPGASDTQMLPQGHLTPADPASAYSTASTVESSAESSAGSSSSEQQSSQADGDL